MTAAQRHGPVRDRSVTAAEAAAAVWTVAPGVKAGGARAVALALAVAWGTSVPTWPWKVPGVPWLLDRCYELVARNRYRLPGAIPWCEQHRSDCI